MRITFIGTGYVGLVSGIMMSHLGHDVICIDTDKDKIEKLNQQIMPIFEPELLHYLKISADNGSIKFQNYYDESLKKSDAIFITVGTPPLESGEADLSFIMETINNITNYTISGLVIIKSTVPPGTCAKIVKTLPKNSNIRIASNPEFLREGNAVFDFLNPDRIIIGTNDKQSELVLHAIYQPLLDKNIPTVSANLETAELIKYASNAFLATKIAFINEIADLSEKCGADIRKISLGVGLDSRIGEKFLKPGPGFGGSCFPKDICALSNYAKNSKSDFLVLDAVIKSNKERPANLVNKFAQFFDNDFTGKCLAILGLAFKAGTDDIRSSPAIEIIKILLSKGANIIAYDPAAMENARKILQEVKYADSALDACINADAVIILTEWPEFKELNFKDIYRQSKKPIIVDLRGILPVTELIEQGFVCYTIGRKYEN